MSNFVPIHGNYRGYYTKRPSFRDPRLALIPEDVFQSARVLDVGCNEGWVTCEIAQSWGAKEVIGVDIDDKLIRAAWKRRRTVWSQHPQCPPSPSEDDQPSIVDPPYKKLKSIDGSRNENEDDEVLSFPAAFEHMFGPLAIPPADTLGEDQAKSAFPHNVVFRAADWVKEGAIEDRGGYDVVLALSVTKWIHLNDGDDGIKQFFNRVFSVLRPGGVFILEPQEWDTYHKAKRMDTKLKANGDALQIRPSEFERELKAIGFASVEHLGKTGKGGFQRALDLYRK